MMKFFVRALSVFFRKIFVIVTIGRMQELSLPSKLKIISTPRNLLLVLAFMFFLTSRLYGVGSDISNSDAGRWHRRSLNFLEAVKTGDLKSTYQRYHPGVTLMLLNAPLNQLVSSYQRHVLKTTPNTLEDADFYPVIHGISKAQIVVVLAFLLLFQFFLIEKIFNTRVALIFVLLISAEPYLIGLDRWFHLTSLETYFSFTALLSLIYWSESKKDLFLYISSIVFCLAALSKLTSLILVPILGLIIVSISHKDRKIIPLLKYGLIFGFTFFILFPAMWASPLYVLKKLYNAIFNAVSTDFRATYFTGPIKWFYYPIILCFKLSPFTLIFFLISIFKRKIWNSKSLWIGLGFMTYLLFLTLSAKKIDRYSLVFFPYIVLFVSLFLDSLKPIFAKISVLLILNFSLLTYLTYVPVNSAYYSPLFGGSPAALKLGVYENSGEYFAQATEYLNSFSRNSLVWIPNGIESFNHYYKGNFSKYYNDDVSYALISKDVDRPQPEKSLPGSCASTPIEGFGDLYQDLVFIYDCGNTK